MKVTILKAYKMMMPNQEINLPEGYAAKLIKSGVAKEVGVDVKKSKKGEGK